MIDITLIPIQEFQRVQHAALDAFQATGIMANMNRANTLAMVKRAGSGHLGSSFSAMDIVTWLYYQELNTRRVGWENPNRDIYFSSKGHDVPGLYAVLYSLGVIPSERYIRLRRYGGLDGHPDIGVEGIEANSGSLGMGISKGKGMAWAKRARGYEGRVIVMTGDGEWQEGQNFEALQTAAQQQLGNLIVIVDHNKVQSDKLVAEIIDLGDLEKKFRAFGWRVARVNGHDLAAFAQTLEELRAISAQPKIIIADTIKGRGVSFMEHPTALKNANGLYPFHAGAPNDENFQRAYRELIDNINAELDEFDLAPLLLENVPPEQNENDQPIMLLGEPVSQAAAEKIRGQVSDEFVAAAYGQALVELGHVHPELVVLDADLSSDCRIRAFEQTFPERFIENGIAEQDMVSMAGGLARMGFLPVVNSFASFLAARANEQIYNNVGEHTKIIYALHYAGLIPAGPGKSHQSIRDISLLAALPDMVIVQPCNAAETKMLLEYCVARADENCAMRLAIGPSPRKIELPSDYQVAYGQGVALTKGHDALLFAYGPVMLHEALLAAELLRERNFSLRVVNMPWLNRFDETWLKSILADIPDLYILDDHSSAGGLGDLLTSALVQTGLARNRRITKFGVDGAIACGTPPEALRHHQLDGASLAARILRGQGK